jgi:hypothetical protein
MEIQAVPEFAFPGSHLNRKKRARSLVVAIPPEGIEERAFLRRVHRDHHDHLPSGLLLVKRYFHDMSKAGFFQSLDQPSVFIILERFKIQGFPD